MIAEKKPNQNYTLAIVLIAIGVLIMLMNFGTLNWFTTLNVLQLWPLALIAVGIDIWTRGRYRLMVVLAALGVGVGLYFSGGSLLTPVSSEQIQQSLESASRATVTITSGVSELRVKGMDDSNNLISGKVDLAGGERAIKRFDKNGDAASYELRSEWPPGRAANVRNHLWDLALTRRIPLNLTIESGVGRSTLDLHDLQLSNLVINTGVGETNLILATGTYKANVSTGVGAITIQLPAGVATRIEIERGLGAVNIRGDFDKDEDVYTSPDYATTKNRIDLRVEGGVGMITVQ